MPEPAASPKRIEELLKEADSASRHVNNVYITFLLLGAYVGVTIASTTHEQLLRISPVTLPLLNVGVPIKSFYLVVPSLLLLFHFNLLLQLYLLSRKLFCLDAALAGQVKEGDSVDQRVLLFSFPFTHMLIGRHRGLVRSLLTLMVWVSFLLLPVILLIWAQIAFLPFHDLSATVLQRSVVHIDLALLWLFWPMIVTPTGSSRDWWRAVRYRLMAGMRAAFARLRAVARLGRKPRSEPSSLRSPGAQEGSRGLLPLTLATAAAVSFSLLMVVLPGEALEQWIARCLPERLVYRGDSCPDGCWTVTQWLCDRWGAPFPRNLRLSNTILLVGDVPPATLRKLHSDNFAEREEVLEQLRGLDLTNRDLRFADLRNSVLSKADLRGSYLDGADLSGADLSAANLAPYDTREGEHCLFPPVLSGLVLESLYVNSPFCPTLSRKVRLSGASLPWAHLDYADLRYSELWGAVLAHASLEHAQLQGASLTNSRLDHAKLSSADLRSASLGSANLRMAVLREAQLQGADLRDAKLEGAELPKAQLDGASLDGVRLLFADAGGAQFNGADLRFADLTATNLYGAKLQGVDLRGAIIGSARLSGADLSFADVRELGRKVAGPGILKAPELAEIADELRQRTLPIGKADTLDEAAEPTSLLCDEGRKLFRGCLSEAQMDLYAARSAEFLVRLGCGDLEVAKGLVRRLRAFHRTNYADRSWSSFSEPILAKGLLAPECKAAAGLPQDARWTLRRAARGLSPTYWYVPRALAFTSGPSILLDYTLDKDFNPGFSRTLNTWLTEDPPSAVLDFYRSVAARTPWQIEEAPGPPNTVRLRVSRKDLPQVSGTITIGKWRGWGSTPSTKNEVVISLIEPSSQLEPPRNKP